MAMVRTNITLPAEVLALVDQVAGPRRRSAYIAEVVARQVRRDNAYKVFRETRGAMKGHSAWGKTPEEITESLREVRDSWDRDDVLWPKEDK